MGVCVITIVGVSKKISIEGGCLMWQIN